MRVLIVGTGYVGLPLALRLAGQGHEVTGLRRSPEGAAELESAGIRPWIGDIASPDCFASLEPRYDWVVNCVAASGGGPADYQRTYVQGMRHLVEWLAAAPPLKLVYTSSTGVYAQDDGSWVDESAATEADSETARALLAAEGVLLEAARQGRVPAVILRVTGIYGPGRGYWFRQFLAGEARLEGAGERHLNMIHRDDVAGAIQAALERGRPGTIYNACDQEPVTQRDFFAYVAGQLGRPMPPPGPPASGSPRRRAATNKRISNQRLVQELGYAFQYPTFREGFAAEIQAARAAR